MAAAAASLIPFVGPRPYLPADRLLFFGRDREARDLFDMVLVNSPVLLYAKSGCGKSSLVAAGLVPIAEREGWKVLPPARVMGRLPDDIRSVGNLLVWNALECLDSSRPSGGELRKMTLLEYLSSIADNESDRLLVFDQFEECFTQTVPHGDREDFFKQVAAAIAGSSGRLWVLFVMREEYIAELEPFSRFLRIRGSMRIQSLSRDAAFEALTGPLQRIGVAIERPAADRLLDSLSAVKIPTASGTEEAQGEFVEPVELQIVAGKLWDSLPSGSRSITVEQVSGLRGPEALTSWLHDTVASTARQTGVGEGEILRWCSEALVTTARTRAIVYRGEDTAGMDNRVVDRLEEKHLVRRDLRAGAVWHELSHDQFINAVLAAKYEWDQKWDSDVQRSRAWEGKAKQWAETGRPKQDLLGPAETEDASKWTGGPEAKGIGISAVLLEYIAASRSENRRADDETRRLRIQRSVLVFLLIIAIASGISAVLSTRARSAAEQEKSKAERDRSTAEGRAAALQAEAERDKTKYDLDVIAAQAKITVAQNHELLVARDESEHNLRNATAYQLAGRVKSTGFPENEDSDNTQLAYKLAHLSAYVTLVRYGYVAEESWEAMRRTLPLSFAGGSQNTARLVFGDNGRWAYDQPTVDTVRIWSLSKGRLEKQLDLRALFAESPDLKDLAQGPLPVVALSADASHLSIAQRTSTAVAVVDVASEKVTVFRDSAASPTPTSRIGVSADGHTVWRWTGNSVKTWTSENVIETWTPETPKNPSGPAPEPSRSRDVDSTFGWVVAASGSGKLQIWKRPDSQPYKTWDTNLKVNLVRIAPGGRNVLIQDEEGNITLWTLEGIQRPGAETGCRTFPPFSAYFSPLGDSLVLACTARTSSPIGGYTRRSWILDERSAQSVEIPNQHQFTAASWRDNETFTTLEGGVANIWSRSGQLVKPIPVTSPLPLAIGFLARGDGQELFTFAGDRQPVTWKIKEGSVKRDPPLEGRWLAATGDSVGTVLALSFDKSSVKIVPATGDSIVGTSFPGGFSIAVSDSGTMVATADFSGVVTIGRPTETSRVPVDNGGPLFGMAMSPNGDALACGLASGKVRLWKAVDGKELKMQELKMPPQSKEASAVAFAGASVAVGYADGSISIVDPEAGSEVPIILGSVAGTATGPVRSFAYQPRLNLLAVARDDKVVVVQLPGGRVLFSTEAYTDTRALAFDPLGRALAMLSRRGIFGLAPLDTNDLFAEVRGRIKKDWTPGEVKECQHLYSSVRPNICPPDMKLSPGGRKPGPGKPASGIGN